jgi:hypothetical protein
MTTDLYLTGYPPMERTRLLNYIDPPKLFEPIDDSERELSARTEAYQDGRSDYYAGLSRSHGERELYGRELSDWRRGWDDAEEEDADETEADFILPMVGVVR